MFRKIDCFEEIEIQRGFEVINFFEPILSKSVFIAGGFARWCVSPLEEPFLAEDIDIFPCNWDDYETALSFIQENIHDVKEINESEWGIAFDGCSNWSYPDRTQLAKPTSKNKNIYFKGRDFESIVGSFDFSVCRAGIFGPSSAMADYRFKSDEMNRIITIIGTTNAIPLQLRRMIRYMEKGYKFKSEDAARILSQNHVFVSAKSIVIEEW